MKKRTDTTYLDEADRLVNEDKDAALEKRYGGGSIKYFCMKCRMTFPIRQRSSISSEKTRCANKGCDVLFWHNANSGWGGRSEVGINHEDAKGLQTTGEMVA